MLSPTGVATIRPQDAHAAFRARRHFGSLDGLRALSVIAVIWHHTVGHDAALPLLFANGAQGVTLFFAISGFLIVTLLLREHEGRGRIDLRAFYMRRALRIFPLYYAVLALYTLLVLAMERHTAPGREFIDNLPSFITYTSNWFVVLEGRVIFYFAWSLATEEQFYLLWPWAQRYLEPARALLLMLGVIVVVAGLQWFRPADAGAPGLGYHIVASVPLAICFGVVLAHLLHQPRSHHALRWLFGWRGSSLVYAGLCLLLLGSGRAPVVAIHLSMALLVGACVYREDHALAPLLGTRALVLVGSVSYGMYLMHMLVKNVVVKIFALAGLPQSHYLVFALTLAGTIAVALLSYRYFEAYFLRRKARYTAPA